MSTASPWINEGSLNVRFREEAGHLVKETHQPDRNEILKTAQIERTDGDRQSVLGGYKVGTIPLNDLPFVRKWHPGLFIGDAESKKKALVAFSNDPRMSDYLIKKA